MGHTERRKRKILATLHFITPRRMRCQRTSRQEPFNFCTFGVKKSLLFWRHNTFVWKIQRGRI